MNPSARDQNRFGDCLVWALAAAGGGCLTLSLPLCLNFTHKMNGKVGEHGEGRQEQVHTVWVGRSCLKAATKEIREVGARLTKHGDPVGSLAARRHLCKTAAGGKVPSLVECSWQEALVEGVLERKGQLRWDGVEKVGDGV